MHHAGSVGLSMNRSEQGGHSPYHPFCDAISREAQNILQMIKSGGAAGPAGLPSAEYMKV
jgi:hypothetical protein